MARRMLDMDVYQAAIARMELLYRQGHRIVCSFSGGKDSTVILHICLEAARRAGCLPVEVVHLDEEIVMPGTRDFLLKIQKHPEVKFHWTLQGGASPNIYNRHCPFFWAYDGDEQEKWVYDPPEDCYWVAELGISTLINQWRFPPPEGKKLISVMGIRVIESLIRRRSISASGSFLTKNPDSVGAYRARPIYDWSDGDVWKTIADYKLEYNKVYDVMLRLGVNRRKLRISVPTASLGQLEALVAVGKSDSIWFNRVCDRLPGVRQAVLYGPSSVTPVRHPGESWSECFHRNIEDPNTPEWIVKQGLEAKRIALNMHKRHSAGSAFPEDKPCDQCGQLGMWKRIVLNLFIPKSMGSHVRVVPRPHDFWPEYYHPKYPWLKSHPWYDWEGLFYEQDEEGNHTGRLWAEADGRV